ncbi:MAG TPA: alpha/beta fold hydrolase [Candidatus Baltobacteraceae bacterium]|jgi:polyhydroxyalkanoate synthase|nr:alpha/beta fold hydrolase [Candidatus Baltobacteraceae bacterium]
MAGLSMAPEDLQYGLDITGLDPASLGDALRAVVLDAMSDPARMALWTANLMAAQQAAGLNFLRRLGGEEVSAPATAGDKRFTDSGWRDNPLLAGVLDEYLARTRAAMSLVESSRLPDATKRKARFAMQMLNDAFSPSNVPWINPAVVKEAMNTGGASLLRGMQNFMEDVRDNHGMPRQVDSSKHKLGVNLAATPGRIVYRNDLMELIAYEPQTAQVHAVPLLCSPPWINKYYIMDLAPGRSFVEWAVLHGHQVFMISYRNPDASMRGLLMDDYLRSGLLAALDAVESITGSSTTNIAALCLGGTLALILLAYLAAHGQSQRVNSATLTNSLIDFSEPGDLGVFTDSSTIERLEKRMNERGYLDSSEMAGTFDWMRANDLIWSYVVSNWFMGKQPPAFDILTWNSDSTRMPAAMHSQYLRACYLNNLIAQPGKFTIADTPIDLGAITTPLYVLGAEADHIAPWRSTYRAVNLVSSSDVKYTLTNSGHIAGIVNPPGNSKSQHWTKPQASREETADEWRATAQREAGSWWTDWAAWAEEHAGPLQAPVDLPAGDPAPGRYVSND